MSAPETVWPPDTVETDITGETDLDGNDGFLLAVFGDERQMESVSPVSSVSGEPRAESGSDTADAAHAASAYARANRGE